MQIALGTVGWFDEGKQVIPSTLPIPCAVTAIETLRLVISGLLATVY